MRASRLAAFFLVTFVAALANEVFAQPATPPAVHVEPDPNADTFSDSVGATPGQFRVDESGAATYTIPLVVPAGTAGVAPKLSLDYNARGGWGPLGPGWALGGQSAITRCKRSAEHGDGAGPHPGINFDTDPGNDAHCLDGQRLLKRGSGFGACPAFGYAAGQEFSPELDTATRVCGYQSATTSPGYDRWLVYPKDGSVRRFGTAGDSKLAPLDGAAPNAAGGNTMTWAMDRLYDATGNYIDFEYLRDNPNGELNLSVVRWTGKVAVTSTNWNPFTATTTRATFARASMFYEALRAGAERTDYLGGATLRSSIKLRRVDLFGPLNSGGAPNTEVAVRSYVLEYAQAATGSRADRLISVHECASATSSTCYPPTRFMWNAFGVEDFSQGYDAPGASNSASNALSYAVDLKVGDINGDGRQDLVFIKDRSCPGNGSDQIGTAASEQRFRFVVMQGTSTPQALQPPINADVFPRRRPPGGGSTFPGCDTSGPLTQWDRAGPVRWDLSWFLFDFTGDGRDDLLVLRARTGSSPTTWGWFVHAAESTAGGWRFASAGTDLGVTLNDDGDGNFFDVTGDGLPDLLYGFGTALSVRVLERLPVTDVLTQLAYRFEASDRAVSYVGFDANAELAFGNQTRDPIRTGDLNGDGVADLVMFARGVSGPGYNCRTGGQCLPCGNGGGQPNCEIEFICDPSAGACVLPSPPPISPPTSNVWRSASTTDRTGRSSGGLSGNTPVVSYWLTARTTVTATGGIQIVAEQCVGGGANPLACSDTTGQIQSAGLSDINGDGHADVVIQRFQANGSSDATTRLSYRLNDGGPNPSDRLQPETAIAGLALTPEEASRAQWIDANGDRRLDVVYQRECVACLPNVTGSHPLLMRLFSSAGFGAEEDATQGSSSSTLAGQNPDEYLTLPMDVNGTGAPALVRYRATGTSTFNVYALTNRLPYGGNDFIVQFTNGLGAQHDVQYGSLVYGSMYERAFDGPRKYWGRGSVVLDVFSPLWAAREASSSAPAACERGVGGCDGFLRANLKATVRYKYGAARVQTGGRGFLGFGMIETADLQNSLTTRTTYRQDFPFIGRPASTEVEKVAALPLVDPCLADPDSAGCFVEPPPNCGPVPCQPPEVPRGSATVRQYLSKAQSQYTSVPSFAPTGGAVPLFVHQSGAVERKFDLETACTSTGCTLVQRVESVSAYDAMGNLDFHQVDTYGSSDTLTQTLYTLNFYGCTNAPVQAQPNVGCTGPKDPEWVRLGRLSLAGTVAVRPGEPQVVRSTSYEYDPVTRLLIAEVQGPYNHLLDAQNQPLYSASQLARPQLRSDYVLDADGNRRLAVTCSVADYANRASCTSLSAFQQRQWSAASTPNPTRIQRYMRYEYDSLGRFVTGMRSPFYSATATGNLNEAYSERPGVDVAGALNRSRQGDPLTSLDAHGVVTTTAYGALGRAYFSRSATGAFAKVTYQWCGDAGDGHPSRYLSGARPPDNATRVNCPIGAVYRVATDSTAASGTLQSGQQVAPTSFSYFDSLGREVLKTTRIYQNDSSDPTGVARWSSVSTRYDVLGRAVAVSEPYFSIAPDSAQSADASNRAGDPQLATTFVETKTSFDAISRPKTTTLPAEPNNAPSSAAMGYTQMSTTATNPRGLSTIAAKNGLGEVVSATDQADLSVSYAYEANGNLRQVDRTPIDGSNAFQLIRTTMAYDVLGRKTAMVDPDKGSIAYEYNALGELIRQTDGKGQVQTLHYDALGRVWRRDENRVTGSATTAEPSSEWEFDTALLNAGPGRALGALRRESLSNGVFSRTTDYDTFGRVRRVQTTIEGAVYTQRMTYDAFGRAFQSFDASTDPNGSKGQLFQYSADGFPIRTREAANGVIGIAYREVIALSPRGQVRRERIWESGGSQNLFVTRRYDDQTGRLMEIGAGMGTSAGAADTRFQRWDYTYDKNGNLTQRWNRAGPSGAAYDDQEAFDYDTRDRLDAVRRTRLNGAAVNTVSMDLAYDGLGNITFKTGRGNYAYKSATSTTGCGRVAGPHAVSVIGGKSYCYDLNGNNTEVRSGGTVIRSIVYTGYDLAERIVRNEQGISATAEFRYGPDRARYQRIDNGTGTALRTCPTPNSDRLFCDGFEEGDANPGAPQGTTTIYVGNVEFITRAGISLVKRYIGDFLVITTENNADSHDILLRDGLGSIDAIVSETGVLRQRLSFDAHGARRFAGPPGNVDLWALFDPFSAASTDTRTTTRGYTGHEQLDGVGLIHMNARLYDPEIGRFIQADSMVEPEATQGLNRYSYVLNNPLTFTDPTGQLSFRQVLGLAVGVAFAIWSGNLWAADKLLASFLAATAGGFTSTLIATGSLKSALWGAASAAAFWGIGTGFSSTTGGPLPNGANETIRFSTGSAAAKVAAHAGAGGVLSHLQGGKFGNAFFAAGVTKWASPAVSSIGMGDGAPSFGDLTAQTVVAATIGGTASVIAGGTFANGAVTAAFARIFGEAALAGGRGSGPSSGGAATLRRGGSRPLTDGEVAMSEEIFFDDIDYSGVKVYRRTYFPGRPRGEAMAPNGNIYFHPDDYLDDFSTASAGTRAWFMHEMTHVWQQQQGISVMLRGAFDRNYSYLPLVASPPGRSFHSFGIEQQGDIVRDYYLLRQGYQVQGAPPMSTYQSVLPFRKW